MGSGRSSFSLVLIWYGVTCLGGALFLYGFFPIGSKLTVEVTDPPSYVENIPIDGGQLWRPHVNRLALLVIDALRTDFITEKYMPFLWSELAAGRACLLTARVESPTVTMPRIKAMTTGAVPQFADLVLNLASSEITHDSFLKRARDLHLNIHFYGDDTWIKLFPDIFARSEGVNSFYVTDYTEVDWNVTRHLEHELRARDWHLLILHYLGLDHIGHVHGPRSSLVPIKLREMDEVARRIASSLVEHGDRSLLLVTGDHGMADGGGHGGASEPETMVPLLAVGRACGRGPAHVRQTDLASTMSALLGAPLPAHNVGRALTQLMPHLDTDHLLYLLHYNALVLATKLPANDQQRFAECSRQYGRYLRQEIDSTSVVDLYEETIQEYVEKLVRNSSTQQLYLLYISCGLLIASFAALTFSFDLKWVASKMCAMGDVLDKTLLYGSALGVLTLASSSFIEEEHQTWYFLCGTLALLAARQRLNQADGLSALVWTGAFICLRTLRGLNQVGDRWAARPDLSDWLMKPERAPFLLSVHLGGLACTWLSWTCVYGQPARCISAISLCLGAAHRWSTDPWWQMTSARLCWLTLAAAVLAEYRARRQPYSCLTLGWTLYIALLLRPYNAPLLAACHAASCSRALTGGAPWKRAIIHAWLGSALSFMQGTCNSLASVDVSAGYIGLSEYQPLAVGPQLLGHTYAFPVLTTLLLMDGGSAAAERARVISALRSGTLAYTCLVTLVHRHHLFVWSVFSPKLLFEAAHTLVLFLVLVFAAILQPRGR